MNALRFDTAKAAHAAYMQKASKLFGEFARSKLMPPLPKQREELFAQHCASGLTNSEAYENAGYKPHRGNASVLRAKQHISDRITELQQQIAKKTQVAVVKQATMSRQYLVDALIENVEVALGRRPVKQGPASIPVEQYVYRWRSG